jgi:hypothetical protein
MRIIVTKCLKILPLLTIVWMSIVNFSFVFFPLDYCLLKVNSYLFLPFFSFLFFPSVDPSLKESVVIKAATVMSLMSVGQKRIQDRFADRGIIAWILGTCYQSIQDSDKSLINAGSYCLLVWVF